MAGDPKPPDPPDVIAARYAEAAKKAVTATAQVAIDAFDKVNGPTGTQPGTLKPKDAIASMAQLAGAALTGGMSLARVALQMQWDRRVLLVADNVASIVGNGLDDVIDVVEDAAKKAGPKPFKEQQQEWVDAAIRLTSVGAIRGAEILETVVAGPGAYANPVIKRPITIADDAKKAKDATLAVTTLSLTSGGPDIKALVTFDPPGFILAANHTDFTLVINTAGLPSGMYEGEVTATDTGPNPDVPPNNVRTFPISIAIPETTDPPES